MNNVYEYDGYVLPEPLKEDTPESRRKLSELMEQAKLMAKRHRAEAKEKTIVKNRKLKYSVLCCVGYIYQIEIWEDDNQLYFAWHHQFADDKKWNEADDSLCRISVEELNQMINVLNDNCEISPGRLVMDPSVYSLDIVDREGKETHYQWSDDNTISPGLSDFLAAIGEIIDLPFSL